MSCSIGLYSTLRVVANKLVDQGTLGKAKVLDTRIENGVIYHLTNCSVEEGGFLVKSIGKEGDN